ARLSACRQPELFCGLDHLHERLVYRLLQKPLVEMLLAVHVLRLWQKALDIVDAMPEPALYSLPAGTAAHALVIHPLRAAEHIGKSLALDLEEHLLLPRRALELIEQHGSVLAWQAPVIVLDAALLRPRTDLAITGRALMEVGGDTRVGQRARLQ